MKNIFKIICKKCGGKCCKLNMMLTKRDSIKLKGKTDLDKFKKYKEGTLVHWGKCPFLDEGCGCTLPQKTKPFDCRFFPLALIYKGGKINLFLNKKCPYADEIPKEVLIKTQEWALKELINWTDKELESYTELIKKHSSSKLSPI